MRPRAECAAGPCAAPVVRGCLQRREWTVSLAEHGRREERANLIALHDLDRLRAEARREVDRVVEAESLPVEGHRLRWKGLGRTGLLVRYRRFRHGTFLDRPDGFTGFAIQDEQKCLF